MLREGHLRWTFSQAEASGLKTPLSSAHKARFYLFIHCRGALLWFFWRRSVFINSSALQSIRERVQGKAINVTPSESHQRYTFLRSPPRATEIHGSDLLLNQIANFIHTDSHSGNQKGAAGVGQNEIYMLGSRTGSW